MSKTTKSPLRKLQSPLRFLLASIQRLEEIANFLLFYASRNLVTKTKVGPYPYRSHLQSLRILSGPSNVLQDSRMTLWRHIRGWSTFRAGRDLKIYMQLPLCIHGSSIMSRTTKTPLRSLQRPLRLHDDALETHRRWRTSWLHRDLKINIQQH